MCDVWCVLCCSIAAELARKKKKQAAGLMAADTSESVPDTGRKDDASKATGRSNGVEGSESTHARQLREESEKKAKAEEDAAKAELVRMDTINNMAFSKAAEEAIASAEKRASKKRPKHLTKAQLKVEATTAAAAADAHSHCALIWQPLLLHW